MMGAKGPERGVPPPNFCCQGQRKPPAELLLRWDRTIEVTPCLATSREVAAGMLSTIGAYIPETEYQQQPMKLRKLAGVPASVMGKFNWTGMIPCPTLEAAEGTRLVRI